MFSSIKWRRIGAATVAGLALTIGAVSPAYGQGGRGGGGPGGGGPGGMFGGGGMARMFEPSVSSKDLDSFATLFALDASQKDAVKTLFDAYQTQFSAEAKKIREKVDAARQEARDSGDPGAFRDVMDQAMSFRKQRDQMEQGFLGDFKAVLTEQQVQKWPKFERMRRRDQTIGNGLMSGTRVDLYKLVDDMKYPADVRKALDPILDQYEVDLDRELVERNKMQEDLQGKMRDLFTSGDTEAADKLIKKGREAEVKVRDVNRRYETQLEAALPEDKRSALNLAFRKESFPQVYRETYASRVIDAAARLNDLDDQQKAGIATIKETFARDMATVQKDMEAAQEDQEMNFSASNMFGRGRGGPNGGGGTDDKMGDLRKKKRTMESDVVDKVKGLLNEKQVDRLPAAGSDNQDNGGPGRRGGNQDDNGGQQRRRGNNNGGDNGGGGGGRRPNGRE